MRFFFALFLFESLKINKEYQIKKRTKKAQGLVDFSIRLLNSVLNLRNGQVKFFGEFKLQKNCA